MNTYDVDDDLRTTLRREVLLLERGDWRAVLRSPAVGGHAVAGSRSVVVCAVVLRLVARSMQLQAQGRLADAWDRLDGSTGVALAVLASDDTPDDTPEDGAPAVPVARLVWREQFELQDLRGGFAAGRVKPRDELIEACIQHLFWVDFDPYAFYRTLPGEPHWDDGTTVDRLRSVLCLRGSRLRRFADPTAGRLSQAVWQDIGGYRGLCAAALDRLSDRPVPVAWCGLPGTSRLVVRRGRLRAWQHARWRREDLGDVESRAPNSATSP